MSKYIASMIKELQDKLDCTDDKQAKNNLRSAIVRYQHMLKKEVA